MLLRALTAALVVLALCPRASAADADAGLYAPAPPPGSAFVRAINAAPSGSGVPVRIHDRSLAAVVPGQGTPYVPVPQGKAAVVAGGSSWSADVEAGHFYTVAFGLTSGGAAFRTLADPAFSSLAKARLALYNLSSTSGLGLTTSDASVTILTSVPAWTVSSREVNALTVGLAVQGPAGLVATFPATSLVRAAAYSVVVRETEKGLVGSWVPSATSTAD